MHLRTGEFELVRDDVIAFLVAQAQASGTAIDRVQTTGVHLTDVALDYLRKLGQGIKVLVLSDGLNFTDLGLCNLLAELHCVEALHLYNAKCFTGQALQDVQAGLNLLTSVQFFRTGFCDDGVAALARAPKLAVVGLAGTQVTPQGLRPLSAAGDLRTIALNANPQIDDSVVDILAQFAQTRVQVELSDSGVTGAGRAKLRKAQPTWSVL